MVNLMMTFFFGTLFCYTMTIFSIGFIFLLRALIMIFFEADISIGVRKTAEKVSGWFRIMKAKSEEKKQIKKAKMEKMEAESRETWLIDDEES